MAYRIRNEADYHKHYQRSLKDREQFWAEVAGNFQWIKPWQRVQSGTLAGEEIDIKWFEGAQLNITANCLDRHLENRGDQVAVIYEPNNP